MKRIKSAALLLLAGAISVMCLLGGCKNQAERDLERAKEGAKQAEDAADRAAEKYDHLRQALDRIEELQQIIATTDESDPKYERAVAENNALVTQLLEEYPELADSVTYTPRR